MLNKEFCKKCINTDAKNSLFQVKWNKKDDERWSKGFVNCFYEDAIAESLMDFDGYIVMKIDTYPPANCPYILEHLMKVQEC
jgi:hypothetical protein